jgi:uncharacterized protein
MPISQQGVARFVAHVGRDTHTYSARLRQMWPVLRANVQQWIRAAASAPAIAARGLLKAYRYALSPLIGFHCRHLPTCSDYSDQAIARFGLWAGAWMTLARLCRCHPFGTSGLDFVPETRPPQAAWWLPWRYGRWRGTNSGPAASEELH